MPYAYDSTLIIILLRLALKWAENSHSGGKREEVDWLQAMSDLSICDDDMAAYWYVRLSDLEKAVMALPAMTVQDYAIKIVIHTNNGDFTPTADFIAEAQTLTGLH